MSAWGAALTSLGDTIPAMVKSYYDRKDTDRRLKMEEVQNSIAAQSAMAQLQEMQDKRAKEEALKQDYEKLMSGIKQHDDAAKNNAFTKMKELDISYLDNVPTEPTQPEELTGNQRESVADQTTQKYQNEGPQFKQALFQSVMNRPDLTRTTAQKEGYTVPEDDTDIPFSRTTDAPEGVDTAGGIERGRQELEEQSKMKPYTDQEKYTLTNDALGKYMKPDQYIDNLNKKLEYQNKIDLASMKSTMTKDAAKTFDDLSEGEKLDVMSIARRRAAGIDPPDQYLKDYPSFAKNQTIRAIVSNLTFKFNPDFNTVQAEMDYQSKMAAAKGFSGAEARERGAAAGETRANENAIPGFEPIPNTRITDDSAKKIKSIAPDIETMKTLANELIEKYEKMGSVFTGDDAADYASKVRNLQLLAKSEALYTLGVLTGPDLKLLEETIPNPSSIKEGIKKEILGDISVRLKNFRNLLEMRGNEFYQKNGYRKVQPKTEPAAAKQPAAPGGGGIPTIKVVNGIKYKKVSGGWQEIEGK